ncbi:PREDICTED: uncharacterized protein LOC104765421 [Camelina sativa]|uniref:Uncharacterized protein LOC104765421 n=1 Tax=Camelina sativa TaxID=90675 RepID=A0ABM1RCQ2_CAMSA|nr:PREDICTED: uncharacterized protein LOC104765421 [Camelina sativa]XP_019096791.1 PREDICTED: uncharacterized protein LOC104765421 [Camelina sativa]XP_019096792.1 PREDICTED: uncharacterized protein LOC104765421 [Camelina sativa]
MGKTKPKKPKKNQSPKKPVSPQKSTSPQSTSDGGVPSSEPPQTNDQSIISEKILAINTVSDPITEKEILDLNSKVDSAKVVDNTRPDSPGMVVATASSNSMLAMVVPGNNDAGNSSSPAAVDTWVNHVKGTSKLMKKKGTAFTLDSGEICVQIPNSVIEKNKKEWDCFIMGQFYSDPPAHGTIHNIVTGIWSKHFRDILVTKMEGNAFLFRIPNPHTRNRVLNQRLWQIEGQTMFVAHWSPGVVPVKPELTTAPIWLELRDVPFQFFNEEGLEHIASLVGDPKFLHPTTANKTNLEVAKVFTIIDPRKPLPEAVNVQFVSGEIKRVRVSSPWMPPVCSFCKAIGHSLKRCPQAPITCPTCNSTSHLKESCPKLNLPDPGPKTKKRQHRNRSRTPPRPSNLIWREIKASDSSLAPQGVEKSPVKPPHLSVQST